MLRASHSTACRAAHSELARAKKLEPIVHTCVRKVTQRCSRRAQDTTIKRNHVAALLLLVKELQTRLRIR